MDNEYDEDKDVAGYTVGNVYLEEKEEVVFPLRNWPFMLGMQLFDFDSILQFAKEFLYHDTIESRLFLTCNSAACIAVLFTN